VRYAEGIRSVPVRFVNGTRSYRTSITGVDPDSTLLQILDDRLQVVTIPSEGVVLNDHLAKVLQIKAGDEIQVEVLEGNRPLRTIKVVGLAKQFLGMAAYMQRRTLNRFMREGDAINGANLSVDKEQQLAVYRELQNMPRVVGTAIRKVTIQNFYDLLAESVIFFTFIATMLGGVIAFGVVYNNARIALAERSRELASLRVLGFTRGEVGYILIGELMLLTLLAVPLGLVIGYWLCHYLVSNLQTDLYRVPLIISAANYTYAALVVIVSSVISSILIWRNIKKLDLIAVLKTKE
jgi:putative ABC transport system permease protein